MIIGLGSDIVDIRRIEKTINRFGDRFLNRVFTATERGKSRQPRQPGRFLRPPVRRQGGLRQGAWHRYRLRRVLARYGGGQFGLR